MVGKSEETGPLKVESVRKQTHKCQYTHHPCSSFYSVCDLHHGMNCSHSEWIFPDELILSENILRVKSKRFAS